MLPVHIKNILTILSLSFDTEKRNWRGKSDAFRQFVQFVTQQEFEEFKDGAEHIVATPFCIEI